MRDIRVATAQFEHRDNDREYNLGRIRELTRRAADQGAEIVSFHECCVSGYSWLQPLGLEELRAAAEPVPDGPAVRRLMEIAREFSVVVMAGLVERDKEGLCFNTYVTVGLLTADKLADASGHRYIKARRPELYGKLVEPQESVTLPGWRMEHQKSGGENG